MSHVKQITETRVYVCHKNMKHEMYGIFLLFFESFRGKVIKKYSTGNELKDALSLRQHHLQVIMYYV